MLVYERRRSVQGYLFILVDHFIYRLQRSDLPESVALLSTWKRLHIQSILLGYIWSFEMSPEGTRKTGIVNEADLGWP